MSLYESTQRDPVHNEIFHRTRLDSLGDLKYFSWAKFANKTMIDVGGSIGAFMNEIIKLEPTITGIVFELPAVVQSGRVAHPHLKHVEGSFFDNIPKGGDVVLLKDVLHNWDDEKCNQILTNVYQALPTGGTLLVMDSILPPFGDRSQRISKDINFGMLFMLGGREQTLQEWTQLLEDGGMFRLVDVHHLGPVSRLKVIEAIRL